METFIGRFRANDQVGARMRIIDSTEGEFAHEMNGGKKPIEDDETETGCTCRQDEEPTTSQAEELTPTQKFIAAAKALRATRDTPAPTQRFVAQSKAIGLAGGR
jgi:hypothetical protein